MWSTLSACVGSAVPCSRSKLAACIHDGHIYMLGGRNGNIPVRDFWKYSLTEHVWSEIRSSGDVPTNLQDHTMTGWKGRLYIFGGEVGFASTGETPLWAYDIATNHWRKLTRNGNNIPQPKGCRGHTSVIHQNAMYIYGGYRDLKGSTNELWCYDFDKESWRLATYTGSPEVPSGRHNHSVVVHDSAMWVYGGMTDLQAKSDFWKWDFVARQWNRVRCKGGPGELHGHTACTIMSSMVIFGGERSGQLLNEIWRFHYATDTWEKLVFHGLQPSPRSRHFTVVVPTLLLLLPHLYDGQQQQQQTPQHKQRRFQELVSSGSYAPSFSPADSSDLEPPPPPRLPKSETISNCRDVASLQDNRKITSSFSHTNFKFLKERISTSNLFKMQNSSYMALSNSSESVQEDSEYGCGGSSAVVVFGAPSQLVGGSAVPSSSPSIYSLQSNKEICSRRGTNKNSGNNRLYGLSLLSVPNFQKIQSLEMRGLMEDLSEGSSVDVPIRFGGGPQVVDNQAYSLTPKKGCVNSNLSKRHSSYLPRGTRNDEDNDLDNGPFCRSLLPGTVCAQDSLENIPDIKDFVSSLEDGNCQQREETGSLKLIDLEADCDVHSKSTTTTPSPSTSSSPSDDTEKQCWSLTAYNGRRPPKNAVVTESTDCLDNLHALQSLPASVQNTSRDCHHKDYASCLNTATTPDGKRLSNLELKMLSRLPNFGECLDDNETVIEESGIGSALVRNRFEDFGNDQQQQPTSQPSSSSTTPQEENFITSKGENNNTKQQPSTNNARHLSMLVLGGREQGILGCGRRPITVWKLDFWK